MERQDIIEIQDIIAVQEIIALVKRTKTFVENRERARPEILLRQFLVIGRRTNRNNGFSKRSCIRHMNGLSVHSHIKVKGPADYVTQVDTDIQRFLAEELSRLTPDIQSPWSPVSRHFSSS